MQTTPKSLRLQIGIFGRTNVGKSSFLNLMANQSVAITSPVPGTTTDVVEKVMELLPIGPVVFLDTAGLDDRGDLGSRRIATTRRVFERADVIVVLCESGQWDTVEAEILAEAKRRKTPVIVVINKCDLAAPSAAFLERVRAAGVAHVVECASTDLDQRERYLNELKRALIECCPDDFLKPPPLMGDLVRPGGLVMMVVPIDLQAPKGRLILPQVMCIRDALDSDAAALVVKEREYAYMLQNLVTPPDLAVCDSQVVMKMVADTPPNVPCTTFSILFSRLKGDLQEMARGAARLESLEAGDRVLIAESCSHHAAEDDIGRVKIPRWLRQYVGLDLDVQVCAGRDFPADVDQYKAIIHCGACMTNRREVLSRIQHAREAGVAITNYGICISLVQGVLRRVLTPFPAALDAYDRERTALRRIPA
ncbi:MAG: [FeFe] hydrogenase H-cluster maturation GTPase HydF [Victivallales bacterium]|nr:[FeFe] hydrogenase H-cluster maturation GTPase HydF [Victivallales bacterium]